MATVKPGSRLKSQVDTTQVIIVKAPGADIELTCGGHPLVEVKAEAQIGLELKPEFAGGSPLGKRFTDDTGDLEVLVTKAGDGALAVGGILLGLKEAKPLPSSD